MNTKTSVIKGLILKDLYNLKKSSKFLLLFLLIYGGISWTSGDFSVTTALLTTMTFLIPLYCFSFDQASHWFDFALTLPITRRIMVTARYVFSLMLIGSSSLILVPIYLLSGFSGGSDLTERLLSFLFTLSILILMLSMLCVSIYRFGLERGRIIATCVCLSPLVIVIIFSRFLSPETTAAIRGWFSIDSFLGIMRWTTALWIAALSLLFFSLLCMWLSWRFSVRIVERQEF